MKLYHYTTFSNFCSIWIQQKLMFSTWTNCNDVYEREKIYNFTQQSREYNGKVYPQGVLKQFFNDVCKEVERYKQISFCLDYKDCKGYASPMMWGHYARDYQRSGVCIELDSSKIKPAQKGTTIYKGKVKYKKGLIATHIGGVNAELEDAAQLFVKKNRKQLFLIKHPHWRPENEYRCVSKDCEFLDISEAITSVYVLWEDNVTLQAVRRIITDSKKVNFLEVGGLKTLKLKEFNFFEYEELQEEMRQWKFSPT